MQLTFKLSTIFLVLFVSNAIVDAGPTPSQVIFNETILNNVCKARKPISKYKPIPKGGKEHVVTEAPTGVAAMKKETLESFALFPLALLPLAVFPLTWTHPNPAGKIRLYHGAEKDIPGGHVNLALSSQAGDFSNKPSFYLTDRPRAALQFACLADSVFYGDPEQIVAAEMWIIEYEWDGGGANIHTFSGTNDPAWKGYQDWVVKCPANAVYQHILDSDMIVGPMQRPEDVQRGVTNNFWQYVIMNQAAADKHLKHVGSKRVKCDPLGRRGNFEEGGL